MLSDSITNDFEMRSVSREKPQSTTSFMNRSRKFATGGRKCGGKGRERDVLFPLVRNLDEAECKSGSESISSEGSLSPAPSPSPCTMLSDMNIEEDAPIKYRQYTQDIAQRLRTYKFPRKSRKRKLNEGAASNCLTRVTLSDGSLCYTMATPSALSQPAPASSPRPAPSAKSTRHPMSEPPKKKRRHDAMARIARSKTPQRATKATEALPTGSTKSAASALAVSSAVSISMTAVSAETSASQRGGDGKLNGPELDGKEGPKRGAKKKPPLVHSKTMPALQKGDRDRASKPVLRRRHSEDWTSRANLLSSLRDQEKMKDELFPSHHVPSVNLEEIFNGQQFIRVHKKIRPINLRRETQMFHIS